MHFFSKLPPLTNHPRYHDVLLIGVMAVLAACGLIYEYLMAHYAGRILGSVDTTIYAMIGLMIVAMGIGAFYARTIDCAFTGFAWLETGIALLGGISVLIMAGLFSFAYVLPSQLQHIFNVNETINITGGGVHLFNRLADSFPYIAGLFLGAMIGMEIPLIARIREELHQSHIKHNAGTVYGADYLGAGIGAAIWVLFCIKMPIIVAAVATASINLLVGFIFLAHYHARIKKFSLLVGANVAITLLLVIIALNGSAWMSKMNNMLFRDEVVFAQASKYQNVIITQRAFTRAQLPITSLYINGHLQFASNDEEIYHGMLVQPPMLAAARTDNILIVGGGDGLALRDILKWDPKHVTLIDLDPTIVNLFQGKADDAPKWLNKRLKQLNHNALNDERVNIIYGDAFKMIESLSANGRYYDVIIVDLPDPNHPDLNKLYSDYFYGKLGQLLYADGAISIQSTSPYHAQKAFISVGKTLASVGFQTEQYHANIPSFGEWGWTIGTRSGLQPSERIQALGQSPVKHSWVGYQQILAAFVFSPNYYAELDSIKVNHLNTPTIYQYHSSGWRQGKGIFFTKGLDQ